jgi:hypothetical protein
MDRRTHWERIYTTKAPDQVSWYRPHLETSLALITRSAVGPFSSLIDVGGGESTLVDDLLAQDFTTSRFWMYRGPQSKQPKTGCDKPQRGSIGSSRTSLRSGWSHRFMRFGMIGPCFISSRLRSSVLPTFARSPAALSLEVMCS